MPWTSDFCSSRWLCARIFFRRSSRGRKFIKPRCSSSGRIALPLKQAAHMASPSITAVAGTSMPARRRCAAQKYFSITHLLRRPGRERVGCYQKTIIRPGRTFDAGWSSASIRLPRHRESRHQTGISPESVRCTCALPELLALSLPRVRRFAGSAIRFKTLCNKFN
jgi:hypothetical protein